MSWIKKSFFALLAILILSVGARFFLYWKDYRFYSSLALKEEADIRASKTIGAFGTGMSNPDEGIVVLTGD